jgi:hypothetical protein
LDTEQVWLLSDAIQQLYNRNLGGPHMQNKVHLSIVSDTEDSFQKQRGDQLEKYMNTVGPDGKPLYYPWMANSCEKRSIENSSSNGTVFQKYGPPWNKVPQG